MKSTSSANAIRHRERGTQIAELAIVLPLLLLFGMMILEAGRFVRAHQVINNAAREAAHISTLPEGNYYVETSTQSNVLGVLSACTYLNNYKNAFPGWSGDLACGEPFQITVQEVNPSDPDAIYVDGVNMPSTRAIVRYRYTLRYMPYLAFFGGQSGTFDLRAKAQFRNFY